MKTNQQNNVFDITLNENSDRLERMSRNRIGWYLRAVGNVEKWFLKKFRGIDPTSERVIRFYTYNDEQGQDYDFKCPNYTYDLVSGLYDDFLEAAIEIGEYFQDNFGIAGRYFYDVKVSLNYEDNKATHSWKVIKTDNPRCILGNPAYRKDCYYLNNFNSKLVIEGYFLSGNYKKLIDVLNDLVNKTIIVHSKSDAKALLRIMKFLGVHQVKIGEYYFYNNPDTKAKFSRTASGYQLSRIDEETVMCTVPYRCLPTSTQEVLDIDEFIVRRSFKSKLRDMGGNCGRRKRNATKRAGIYS